ncbi:MAG: 50S ribosomal protein L25 [Dehalococcoidia bacterium]|jgi:large subunit ribosomal protein L25|nr:50S ribosomal protein L25 [Dehalococcoidia bacterium]MEB2284128.1 50S ribosomal protein L25 [Myxococcales bacterium]
MEEITLTVEARADRGKSAARRLRRTGKIPAVFYGPKSEPTPIAIDRKAFATHVANLEGSHLVRFQSTANELQQRVALVREVQQHPANDSILHVDFYEVDLSQRLKVTVPLHFVGRAKGVAEGGILQPIVREMEIECLPIDIPQFIEVDVTALDIHDALHFADVVMPTNVTAVFDANEAIVNVLPPTVEEVTAGATEGEGQGGAAVAGGEAKEIKEAGKS